MLQALTTDPQTGDVFMFGGEHASSLLDELWVFNFKTESWLYLDPRPDPDHGMPVGRRGHALAALNGKLYLFGGQSQDADLNDLWAYDIHTNAWEALTAAPAPPARAGHSIVVIGDDIVVFGGFIFSLGAASSELWAFNTKSKSWTLLSAGAGGLTPEPRYGHGAVALGNNMVVYGGESESATAISTVDLYDRGTQEWTSLQFAGASRAATDSAVGPFQSHIVSYGGLDNQGNALSDMVMIPIF